MVQKWPTIVSLSLIGGLTLFFIMLVGIEQVGNGACFYSQAKKIAGVHLQCTGDIEDSSGAPRLAWISLAARDMELSLDVWMDVEPMLRVASEPITKIYSTVFGIKRLICFEGGKFGVLGVMLQCALPSAFATSMIGRVKLGKGWLFGETGFSRRQDVGVSLMK